MATGGRPPFAAHPGLDQPGSVRTHRTESEGLPRRRPGWRAAQGGRSPVARSVRHRDIDRSSENGSLER